MIAYLYKCILIATLYIIMLFTTFSMYYYCALFISFICFEVNMPNFTSSFCVRFMSFCNVSAAFGQVGKYITECTM